MAVVASVDFTKDPSEVLDYTWNWLPRFQNGEQITSFTASSTPGINVDSTSFSSNTSTTFLSGGTAGNPYKVTHMVVTNQGRTFVQSFTVRVTLK